MAVVLLGGAGLMTRSVAKMLRVDPGVDARGLHRVFYDASEFMNQSSYDLEAALARGVPRTEAYGELHRVRLDRWSAFQRQALERLHAVPGVEMAAVNVGAGYENYEIDGQPGPVELGSASVNVVGGDSLRTLGARLIMGRFLDPADAQPGESGVVINRQMATVCWPGENPLGKLFRRPRDAIDYRVVGVIENIQDWRMDFKATPIFYEPYERSSSTVWSVGDYVIRSPLSAEVLRVGIDEAGNDAWGRTRWFGFRS